MDQTITLANCAFAGAAVGIHEPDIRGGERHSGPVEEERKQAYVCPYLEGSPSTLSPHVEGGSEYEYT